MHPRAEKCAWRSCVLAILVALTIGFLCFIFPTSARAQVAGATLTGNVTDAQGVAVPNAKVTATNNATNVSSSTNANAVGAYTIAKLNPGDCQVSAEASGFSKAVSKVTLTVGECGARECAWGQNGRGRGAGVQRADDQAFFNAAPPFGCDTTTTAFPAGESPLTCYNLLGNLGRQHALPQRGNSIWVEGDLLGITLIGAG